MRRKRRGRQAFSAILFHLQTLLQFLLIVRVSSAAESGGIGGGIGGIGGVLACPAACRCRPDAREASCRGANLAHVPAEWSDQLRAFAKLDLAGNNISSLEEFDFVGLPDIEDLVLSDNRLEKIHPKTFARNNRIKRLVLQNCTLQDVPWEALQPLTKLSSLHLDHNEITDVPAASFLLLGHSLRRLRIDANRLSTVPTTALDPLRRLEALNLGSNKMSILSANTFGNLNSLVILLLKRNQIHTIDDDAFTGLDTLRVLELDDNLLTQIPVAITRLTTLQELSVSGNRITFLAAGILQRTTSLTMLEIRGNPLLKVHPDAFSFLPRLRKLILSEARELREFPNLNGTSSLEILRLDRANIIDTPNNLCFTCPRLKSLDMKSNQLTKIPLLHDCTDLRLLDLTSNKIASLDGQPFRGLTQLHDLLLAHNRIQRLSSDSFAGLTRLQLLDLEDNVIVDIHPDAFLPFTQLEDLNLANNVFPSLPPHSTGWERLLHLKTFNNPALREIPPPQHFPRVQTLVLSYAYHCCAFLPDGIPPPPPKRTEGPTPPSFPASHGGMGGARPPLKETVLFPSPDADFDLSLWNSSHTDIWPQLHNLSKKFGKEINDLWDSFGTDFTYPGNLPAYVEEYFEEQDSGKSLGVGSDVYQGRVQCLPLPGPFLPCEDLFDWWTLRCGVWIVFLLAMLGNGTVVFVLVFSRSKMDVPRFLVCNLAMADFFMGIYLGFLAVVDASTLGEFRKYAIPWQMSAGCQLAGFLGVLSSELSVYTLAVITLERNYAITHAMHLNKRLSLKHAAYIMAIGWSFALVMALLPLVGVSDYRIFAVCLPFEAERPHSLAYVVFLMLINGVAFLILMGCYLKMYCAIRGSQAWNSNDSRIAKRMALLVFTDFLCWSPIAFFSLTAAFGLQLVSLEQAKVFTVFVLPLNSCCNPFLYAILTKQFKKDCVLICKAIEESRVTRGIGRCRHSSNFSNRQTPANTNSLVDRSSREHVHAGGQIPCTCTAKLLTHGHHAAGVGVEAGAPHVASASNMTRGRGKSAGAGPNAVTTSTSSNSSAPVASTSSSTRLRPGRGSDSSTLNPRRWLMGKASWLLCHRDGGRRGQGRNSGGRGTGGGGGGGSRARSDQYAHQIAEIQQKQHKRASSVSSENFSSSRSDSWRQNNCGLPLRLLDPKKRSSWLVTRKTSQDSNLSSSRNDSSGTATSASTATWRMSRSSASGCTAAAASATITAAAATAAATSDALSRPRSASPNSAISPEQHSPPSIAAAPAHQQHQPHHHHHHHTHLHHPHDWTAAVHHGGATPRTVLASVPRPKPRLTRQSAISDEEPPGSPGRLAVRFLTTIPSAAETSVQNDEEEADQGPAEEDGEDDLAMTPLVTGRRSLPTVRLVALPAGRGVQQRRPSALSSPPRTLVALQLLDSRPTALVPLRRCSTGQTSQVSPGGGSTQNRSPQSVRSSPAPSPTLSPCSPGTGEAGIAETAGTSGALGTSRSTGPTGTSGATPREEKPT